MVSDLSGGGGTARPADGDDEAAPESESDQVLVFADAVVGRYRLCFELAAGGMATVYLARTEGTDGFGKLVALKRIHPHLARERAFVEMFLDEARLASRIAHPNVCPVFDFGKAGDSYYLAMEYLMGEPLQRVSRALRRQPPERVFEWLPYWAARIVADACEGLHAAHELRGDNGRLLDVVHRDVSPQNIFVTYDGAVRIVDFGIAKAASRLHHTATGTLKGKVAYMAPEQMRSGPIDRRADVWALGVCLWELCTLKRLFRRAQDTETVLAVMSEPAPPPSSARPELPETLDAVVLRALARNPAERYATARDFGRELNRFLTSANRTVGMAEVAERMEELFAADRARRMRLADEARRAPAGPVCEVPPAFADREASASQSLIAPSTARTARPRARWVVVLLLLAFGATAAVLTVRWQTGTEEAGTGAGGTMTGLAPPPIASAAPQPATGPSPASPEALQAGAAAIRTAILPGGTEGGSSDVPPPPPASPADAGAPLDGDHGAGGVAAPPGDEVARGTPPTRRDAGRGTEGPSRTGAAPDRPAAPAREETGLLEVETVGGWAEVLVDGRTHGRTPARIRLAPGRHRVRLLPFGQEPAYEETVVVGRGGEVGLTVRIGGP